MTAIPERREYDAIQREYVEAERRIHDLTDARRLVDSALVKLAPLPRVESEKAVAQRLLDQLDGRISAAREWRKTIAENAARAYDALQTAEGRTP